MREAVLAHWSEGGKAARRTGAPPARSIAETLARDVTSMEKTAGRLHACLATTPLAAMGPAADIFGQSLGRLDRVLRALSQTIAGALAKASIA